MEVKLIKVECVVGWSMEGENLEEMKKLGLSETSNSLVLKIQK
jgi:hypothetical protein